MNRGLDTWVTKKTILLTSVAGFVLSYILYHPLQLGFCNATYTLNGVVGCEDKLPHEAGAVILLFNIPLLFFSSIIYRLHNDIFRSWIRFTIPWVLLSLLLILTASDHQPANIVSISNQQVFFAFFWFSYLIISIFVISRKYWQTLNK